DKRPSQGELTTAHIMVKLSPTAGQDEIDNAKKKIDEIYGKLENGEDFARLAEQFSDDRGSAAKGGELPPFKAGRMVIEFEEAAFNLKNDGEVSAPVKTAYGWHIIKRLGKRDLQPLEDIY